MDDPASTSAARAELRRLLYGFRAARCLHAAAALDLPGLLAGGPRPAAELARAAGADRGALERLLVALAGLGVVERAGDGFALTPVGELLRGDVAGSLRAETLAALDPEAWRSWGELTESVRSGAAAFPRLFGTTAWRYRAEHPESRARFDAMAAERARAETEAVLERLELPARGLVVDVGGGTGELLAGVLERGAGLSGALLEQPAALAGAERRLAAAEAAGRCRRVAGDFLESVPSGGALYLLKAVLHNWDDAAATRLLAVCRRAMTAEARLVVIERLAEGGPDDDAGEPGDVELQDLHMLVVHGGRERRLDEYAALLAAAGLRLVAARATHEACWLLEAAPV